MPCPIIGRDPVDTERKLNVRKTPWTSSERLIYVQFTSCVYGGSLIVSDLCSVPGSSPAAMCRVDLSAVITRLV